MTYTRADVIPIGARTVRSLVTGESKTFVKRWRCCVPGCVTEMAECSTAVKHANRQHVACRCGWVGVSLAHHLSHRMTIVCADAGALTLDKTPVQPWQPPNMRASAVLASPGHMT